MQLILASLYKSFFNRRASAAEQRSRCSPLGRVKKLELIVMSNLIGIYYWKNYLPAIRSISGGNFKASSSINWWCSWMVSWKCSNYYIQLGSIFNPEIFSWKIFSLQTSQADVCEVCKPCLWTWCHEALVFSSTAFFLQQWPQKGAVSVTECKMWSANP